MKEELREKALRTLLWWLFGIPVLILLLVLTTSHVACK
jgi:hypothetical protein